MEGIHTVLNHRDPVGSKISDPNLNPKFGKSQMNHTRRKARRLTPAGTFSQYVGGGGLELR